MKKELLIFLIVLIFAMGLTGFRAPGQNSEIFDLNINPTAVPTAVPTGPPAPTSAPNTPTAFNARLSGSKLGIFYIYPSSGGLNLLQSGPKVIKLIDPQNDANLMQYIRDYKRMFPGGIVVMRVIENSRSFDWTGHTSSQAANDANYYWNNVLAPAVAKMSAADKALISYLSGPNEFEGMPFFTDVASTQWINSFSTSLANLIKNNGFKPMLYDIPVGNPANISFLQYILPSLRIIKNLGGAWSYHAYTEDCTRDPNNADARNFSLRYRQFYNYFASFALDLVTMPLILTEGGAADHGDPYGGYRNPANLYCNTSNFQSWLSWFDGQIRSDSYVLGGITLFQSGNDSDWSYFNLEPISVWLSNYLITH